LILSAGAEDPVAAARRSLEGGDGRRALEALRAVLRADERGGGSGTLPRERRAEALALLGQAHRLEEDPEAAAAAFEEALAAGPGPDGGALALVGLAEALLDMRDGAGAHRALARLPPEARKLGRARLLAALALQAAGRRAEAEALLREALARGPAPEAEHALGVILFERGEFAAAIVRFEAALRLDPRDYYSRIYLCACAPGGGAAGGGGGGPGGGRRGGGDP
jgi:thioredoxin-like negative regulator of GroEL